MGIRHVKLKVFLPEQKKPLQYTHRAKPGMVFADAGIDQILDDVADNLEQRWPELEFRLVQVGIASYNFIYAGRKHPHGDNENVQVRGITHTPETSREMLAPTRPLMDPAC
jgi:hypothetical protein